MTESTAPSRPRQHRRMEGKRLAYYVERANNEFWDAHWTGVLSAEQYDLADAGHIGIFDDLFTRHLPRQGKILEAGCGLGLLVAALRARGYDCEGVESAGKTVEAVRALRPNLPVRTGDVTRLDVPDRHYRAYISLGVIEHRREGPEPFLREARRVLDPAGVMLVSVPHLNIVRRLKARLGLYGGSPTTQDFYQYAFTEEELSRLLADAGFRVIERFGYDAFKGLKDEISLFKRLAGSPAWRERLRYRLGSWRWAEQTLGHMILLVCR